MSEKKERSLIVSLLITFAFLLGPVLYLTTLFISYNEFIIITSYVISGILLVSIIAKAFLERSK